MSEVHNKLRQRLKTLCQRENLLDQNVRIRAKALTTEEAIGNPEDDDFPLQTGKERLMQAEFSSGKGQAFTDHYGNFSGRISQVMDLELTNNYRRAVFVASLNAILHHLGLTNGTVHCRDQGPRQCAPEVAQYLAERYSPKKILQIGFQPRLVERLQQEYQCRVVDLDPGNIGSPKGDLVVEGPGVTAQAIQWADLLLVTGTTLVNDTIDPFLAGKPVVFYGTTIAGAAYLMNWDRICPQSF